MSTWSEIKEHIARNMRPTAIEEHRIALVCRFESYRQSLVVRRTEGWNGAMLEIAAPIGHESQFSQRAALVYNRASSSGAIVLDGHEVLLRHVVAMDAVTTELLERALSDVAAEAARLASLRKRSQATDVFAYIAD